MAELRVTGLVKRYGNVAALDGVDLEVAAGEFFVILGPSAAGKTTTLRTIAGLERPDAGTIAFAGQDVTHAPVQGRGMAMIFQTFALYPHLSTFDNLAYPLRESGVAAGRAAPAGRRDRRDARHRPHARPPARTLSGGEQQRVAIGRALIRRPSLLLLDEPLTNLDAKLRHDTRAEFKRLHRELGMTMVYATPDQLEALTMGERIAVLRDGRIVQTGTPDELYRAPRNSFVATMVGAPPMNLVPGRVRERARRPGRRAAVRRDRRRPLARTRWPAAPRCCSGSGRTISIRRAPSREGPRFPATVAPHRAARRRHRDRRRRAAARCSRWRCRRRRRWPIRHGADLAIELSLRDAHLFHRETGAALA